MVRKTLNILTLLILTVTTVTAQFGGGQEFGSGKKYDPVKWSGEVEKVSDTEYILHYDAEIEDKWHVYSQFTPEDGPIPLHFEFLPENDATYALDGKAEESPTHREYSDVFEVDEVFWEETARLSQKVTLSDASTPYIKSIIKHQSCIENGVCINQEFYIVHDLVNQKVKSFTNYTAFEDYGGEAKTDKNKDLLIEESSLSQFNSTSNFGGGQKYDPVKWSGSIEKTSETEYVLHYDAVVEDGWYIYAQGTPAGLPLKLEFTEKEIDLKGKATESETKTAFDEIFEEDVIKYVGQTPKLSQKISTELGVVKSIITYQVCKEVCIQQEFYVVHDLEKEEVKVFTDYNAFEAYGGKTKGNPQGSDSKEESKGLWSIFLLSFLGGLAALFTPCVFPMIPMTVGFFTKQSKNRASGIKNAIIYGVSIILIYVVLGLVVTGIFGADSLNALSTSVAFNLIFFIILVLFAISFLGAFEIVLPNSWANKVDRQADRGGIVGIFFMALALAIVSFSCTGPIVGTTLVQAASKGGLAPAIGMLGFSSAIAIPFALFAMFPGWMNTLPKSGGWLNSVKVVLGFLELALAFKFLSNADLVLQAHLLEREVFLAIIIAILIGLTLYLFGKIKLPHDSDLPYISIGRLSFGLIVLSFVIYLIPGLWGAPLKLISGFPPPMNYSESPYGVGSSKGGVASSEDIIPEHAELGPHDIVAFTDYDAGLKYAKTQNKPVLLDFTGYACINCRRMEERVWSEPKILNLLKNDVVLVSLYADAKENLPESEQYVSETTGQRVKTIGNKWSDFQIKRYQVNAQPYYVLMDHDESNLNTPVGYTPDIEDYEAWLKEGITRFNNN